MTITKDECLMWINSPNINPKTGHKILFNKKIYINLLNSCKTWLTPEEVTQQNPELAKIMYPNHINQPVPIGKIPIQFKPKSKVTSSALNSKSEIINKISNYITQTIELQNKDNDLSVIKMIEMYNYFIEPQTLKLIQSQPKLLSTIIQKTEETIEKGYDELIKYYEIIAGKPYDANLSVVDQPKLDVPKFEAKTQIAETLIKSNNFKVPNKIKYQLNKLNDKNKSQLETQTNQHIISESAFDQLMASDVFIQQLLHGERKWLNYKQIQYVKIIKQITDALADPLLQISSNDKNQVANDLIKKLNLLNANDTILKQRLIQLGINQEFTSDLILDKRQKINKIINDPEHGIKTLLGKSRESIRRSLLAKIVSFAKVPELYINRFNNYTLMGGAGSGKTKLAGVLANFFYNLGILNTSKVIYVTRADLVAGYIGQTAPRTRSYLANTLEGVLFIDEAYQLSGCPDQKGQFSSQDFGAEAITEIVNYIDKHIGLSVIITAGYEDKINNCFLKINEGMRRRFPNNLRLLPYTSQDLSQILYSQIIKMFTNQILTLSQTNYIDFLIVQLNAKVTSNQISLFSNQAGDMLNLSNAIIQDLILNQDKGYKTDQINTTFTRFFISKGLQVLIK